MPANKYYQGPPSDHFDDGRFFNPRHPNTDRGLKDLLRWRFEGGRQPWTEAPPVRTTVPEPQVAGLRVTMVGHASVLIQLAGRNLLVDPVWSERVSPVRWAGPRRVNAPGIRFEDLPPIHAVLLTHDHYDHLDIDTLKRLQQAHRPRFVAPLGNDAVIAGKAPEIRVDTLDWGQSLDLGADITACLQPANHWSARSLGDRRMALWGGYVIRSPAGTVYVVGDTGYGDGEIFREVGARFPDIDFAVIPIGAYAPRWFMKDQHVDPAEAVRIMADCGARRAFGVHWGTFRLTDEARTAPKEELAAELQKLGLPPDVFVAAEPGDVWDREASFGP
ncbi:L-ascorbate metabolism protein UlaG, beta-lactamase superfamily [Faunimonas pinastri]|uniref:L-ascorbate metabolism protein UlaG, beta-lactamase superfamily n=1 Tax=Faunimonas pinastri TaxID=1855383 RepID=A0A1H9H0Q2_9HYPH|nr:MBL fold metallo-hydrolase [Faunimonas pinastri]SEQ55843.1 L-ascorbate metabolism protein UlaG, beta-lactamase superfamily [Faunimonas pinastri]